MLNNLGPRDLVAVMYPLTPLDAVQLTRDHQSVVRTIERFEGRKFNYEPRNSIEERYALYPAETVERIRRQVSMSALEGLSVKLGALREGRKAIVIVSEGFTSMLPPQLRDPVASMPGMGNPEPPQSQRRRRQHQRGPRRLHGQIDMQQEMRDVFNAANRSNTAIYAVDPRGLATGEFDINENVGMTRSNDSLRQTQDTLRVLADETDGRAIVNRNDLAQGDEADRHRLERVLPARLQLDAGAAGRQVPRDQSAREAAGDAGAIAQGVLGADGGRGQRAIATPRPGPPPAVNRALASIAEPARGSARAHVDGHRARRQRQDAR